MHSLLRDKNPFQYNAYRALFTAPGGVSVQGVSLSRSTPWTETPWKEHGTKDRDPQKEHGTRDRDPWKEHGTRQPDRKWHHNRDPSPPPDRMTDTGKNITSSQTSFAGGKNVQRRMLTSIVSHLFKWYSLGRGYLPNKPTPPLLKGESSSEQV